jgi:selenocysteine-specific translation elongation factor
VVNCSYDEAMRQVHQMTTALSEQTDSRGPLMPRFMTVRFAAEDGIERLRRKFADLQKQNP